MPTATMAAVNPMPCMPNVNGRYSPNFLPNDPSMRQSRQQSVTGNFFPGLDDTFLARASAEALADIKGNPPAPPPSLVPRPHEGWHHPSADSVSLQGMQLPMSRPQMISNFASPTESIDPISSVTNPWHMTFPSVDHSAMSHHPQHPQMGAPVYSHSAIPSGMHINNPLSAAMMHAQHNLHDTDYDPRELERFAERFKQRRIKLGVTQADVGRALGELKLPGVGSLSQSTICRFESLTLSHNNMVALKPVLEAWLDEAERSAREAKAKEDGEEGGSKKRKRTSIAAPEKRSLEAYFAVQPRPSGEKIAQIADKLDLKKNVVRVWFCNQRQKQKRMKFSSGSH